MNGINEFIETGRIHMPYSIAPPETCSLLYFLIGSSSDLQIGYYILHWPNALDSYHSRDILRLIPRSLKACPYISGQENRPFSIFLFYLNQVEY
ncbi:MAG: hypothetical protein ACJA01_002523 [Saprospiraceae bacterium]|jgi:hypothetical protein